MLMKGRLTINNSVCGRWLLSLFTMLLVSVGMQAEDYDLWVAGTQVTSDNASNVLNDNEDVHYIVFDASTNTLTLNNYDEESDYEIVGSYQGAFIKNGLANLTINLVGFNRVHCSLFLDKDVSGGEDYTATLTTSTNSPGRLILCKDDESVFYSDHKIVWKNGLATINNGHNSDHNCYEIELTTDYRLSVGGTIICTTNGDVVEGTFDNKVTFDATSNTLTLNGATINGTIYSSIADLKVKLVGVSVFNVAMDANSYTYVFNYTGNDASPSLTFSADNLGATLLAYGDQENNRLSLEDSYNLSYNPDVSSWINTYRRDTGTDNKPFIRLSKPYLITIAGENIDDSNKDNVMGDDLSEEGSVARVSFNATTNTLTLNKASISAYNNEAIVSGLYNLTIFLVGESSIFGGSPTFSKTSDVENATITFTTDGESNGSLFINNVQENLYGEGLTPVYSYVFIKDEGYSQTISSQLGVSVGGVSVTLFNKDDVMDDGKVSYNPETYTLTLNNATIEPEGETPGIVHSNAENLKIALIGNNSIQGGAGCSAISHYGGVETYSLSFAKGDPAQHFSLTLIGQNENNLIDGFNTNYGVFFVFDNENDGIYTSTITSTILSGGSGTSTDPFIIKTTDDLKNFSEYINGSVISNTSYAKLSDDISQNGLDCSSATVNPIGYGNIFFAGTFDGNGKTIKNLTIADDAGDCVGFFRILGENGMIENLTLDNLTLSGGNSSSNDIGGLVAYLNGGAISNCTIKNSTISCKNNTQSPTVGGLVGELSSGSITNSTVHACTVNAVTQDTGNSGPVAYAGGIVGNAAGGTITGCQVKGETTMLADYGTYSASVVAGAIVARKGTVTLSNNTYEYTVTASTNKYNGTSTELTTKSGYTQRAIGGQTYNEQTQQYEDNPDIFTNNGAVMYTKSVALPAGSNHATVIGEQGTYYATVEIGEGLGILVAPNQTATLNAIPENGYVVASFTATNTTTSEAITTTATEMEGNEMQYTFAMPDAPVSVAVTTATAYGISIAGVTVTELNAANILGDGTVSYNASKHTLTLNGATIGNDGSGSDTMEACGIDYSETADLTISLKGTNTIYGMGGCNAIRYNGQGDVAPKLIFTKGDDQECSLQLNTSSDYERTAISGGFSEIQGVWGVGTTDNGLAIIADKEVKYDSEDGLTIEKVVNYTVNYVPLSSTLIASYYGLAISGVPVYEGNKSNITGEGIYGNGTASFDLTTNTLTLNNVNLNPDYAQNDGDLRVSIVTSLAQLNINLIGESQTYAIKTTNESGTLTFKSAEANRGAARLNFWYNAEPYYIGFGENKVTYNDGLCLRNSSSNSSFPKVVALYVPKVVTEEKERGLYYPDHEFTFSMEDEVEGFDIYYANMLGGDPVKTTNGKFTLAEGRYTLRVYPIYPGMDTDPSKNSQFASERYAKVIAKPTFSEENGTYNESFTLTLQNVPEQDAREEWAEGLSENIMVPQVWYFINDNKNDSIRYDATKGISVTESCKVSVYVIDVDSAKKLKSTPVEAHYVIRQDAGLAYTQNNESIEVAEYTIGGENNPALPTLQNENELAVTFSSEDENVATVNAETGAVTIVGVGRTTISATSEQTDVLLAGAASYTLTVYKDLSHESITVTVADMTYTGEAVSPEVTVMDGETDITELMIISYDNNVEVGNNATVTIVDLEVNFYVGSRTKTFSIVTRTLEIGKDVNFASGQKWASFYTTTEDLLLPEGVMAYIVTAVGNDVATVKAINYVPKNVPVLIEKESTTTTDNTSAEGNLLRGTTESTAVSGIEGNVYVLYNGGFTRTTTGAIPARRAYLVLEQAAGARLSIVEGEATDITSVGYDSVATDGSTYDMQGRKVESLSKKGLYIKNGRKVVIK